MRLLAEICRLSTLCTLLVWKERWQSHWEPLLDLYEASINELQDGLELGKFTSVDLVKAYLARIEEVNLKGPALRAVIETNPLALVHAATLDTERKKGKKRSALHGIPIIVKDNIATLASEGMNTTSGSWALYRSVVPGDATTVAKLRKAGAIILGKANLSEWSQARGELPSGWSARGGQGTNPYYPNGDPCGSSSGSGVVSAIGLAAGALGTETDGSITCPSSYNNVVGIKPTVGLTSRAGVIPITSHQDTVGPMTRSVADGAIILNAIVGHDVADNYTLASPSPSLDYTKALDPYAIAGKRFGVPRTVFTNDSFTMNDPYVNIVFEEAIKTIKGLGGIIVDPADLPSALDIVANLQNKSIVSRVDMKIELGKYFEALKEVPTSVRSMADVIAFNQAHPQLEATDGYKTDSFLIKSQATTGQNSTYYQALYRNRLYGRTNGIDHVLTKYNLDALILPSNGWTASLAAIAGYPVVTVPLGFFPANVTIKPAGPTTVFPAPGLPFGISFLGTAFSEFDLIGFAYAYEQKTKTRLRGPKAYPAAIPKTQLKDVIYS